jgi:hypothetical protein
MRLLKLLVNFVVATVVGAAGNALVGPWGLIVGFAAGGCAGWWVARRLFP